MPTLEFKGKPFVYAHHLAVPYRTLEVDAAKSTNAAPHLDDNLIIHGDNLHALKALLPRYAGRVKCIYIDPPYNTGNEGWCYNDNVNAPLIREWLKDSANSVDKEDLERHDKWLCMMWPRLQLLRELLSDDGVIFVSIDYNENSRLRIILDEIFEEENFVGEIYWESKTKSQNTVTSFNKLQPKAEMIFVYTKKNKRRFNLIEKGKKEYPLSDKKGEYREYPLEVMNAEGMRGRETMVYPVTDGVSTVSPPEGKQWKLGQDQVATYKDGGDLFIRDRKVIIKMRPEFERLENTEPFWGFFPKEMGTAESAKKELKEIIGPHNFETVKPVNVVKRLIFHATSKDDIILDSFAGSGTTAHAVLALNKEDGGNRKFILVECEDYADTITAERVRRVIRGVPGAKDAALQAGLGGSFTFCELGAAIDMDNLLKGDGLPNYATMAAYIFHTATGGTLNPAPDAPHEDYCIGETATRRVHLLYRPDLDFLRSGDSALSMPLAERIGAAAKEAGKTALVFATHKFMGQDALTPLGITFAQLPYALHRRMEAAACK
jgi:adenine-specific DNA-methyltransferase